MPLKNNSMKNKLLLTKLVNKPDRGFTLIELLVVIIIIGILSAISLPSFLNQANKAKQSEAKVYIGTLNRVQQAYYLEQSNFASDLTSLANPIPSQTDNYDYSIVLTGDSDINRGSSRKDALKSYAGMVALNVGGIDGATNVSGLCEASVPGTGDAPNPVATVSGSEAASVSCGAGSTLLGG